MNEVQHQQEFVKLESSAAGPSKHDDLEPYEIALNELKRLKQFLLLAPHFMKPGTMIKRHYLPEDAISCVLWNQLYFITGTDIVRCLSFRFTAFGRKIIDRKKFEEGIFSDLRNLKCETDAVLEEPKSEFLDFLYKNNCVRTQKKQKLFFWYSVSHEKLFLDALERDLKKEASGKKASTESFREPAFSLRFDSSQTIHDQLSRIIDEMSTPWAAIAEASTSSSMANLGSAVAAAGLGAGSAIGPVGNSVAAHQALQNLTQGAILQSQDVPVLGNQAVYDNDTTNVILPSETVQYVSADVLTEGNSTDSNIKVEVESDFPLDYFIESESVVGGNSDPQYQYHLTTGQQIQLQRQLQLQQLQQAQQAQQAQQLQVFQQQFQQPQLYVTAQPQDIIAQPQYLVQMRDGSEVVMSSLPSTAFTTGQFQDMSATYPESLDVSSGLASNLDGNIRYYVQDGKLYSIDLGQTDHINASTNPSEVTPMLISQDPPGSSLVSDQQQQPMYVIRNNLSTSVSASHINRATTSGIHITPPRLQISGNGISNRRGKDNRIVIGNRPPSRNTHVASSQGLGIKHSQFDSHQSLKPVSRSARVSKSPSFRPSPTSASYKVLSVHDKHDNFSVGPFLTPTPSESGCSDTVLLNDIDNIEPGAGYRTGVSNQHAVYLKGDDGFGYYTEPSKVLYRRYNSSLMTPATVNRSNTPIFVSDDGFSQDQLSSTPVVNGSDSSGTLQSPGPQSYNNILEEEQDTTEYSGQMYTHSRARSQYFDLDR